MRLWIKSVFTVGLMIVLAFSVKAQDTLITNYPDSKKVWEKLFEEGKKIKETIYYENGQVWMTASYNTDEKEDWNWFYENGNPFFSAKIVNEELQGNYRIWYENGQLAESLNFVDNIEQGEATYWYPNGQLATKGVYTDGKMTGEWNFYAEDGSPAEGIWNWKFAALNQFVRMEGFMISGKRVGTWVYRGTAERGSEGQLVFVEEF